MTNSAGKLCFARRHMPPQVESFHGYALATSRKSGVFYSDVRRDADDYGVNKDTITAWTKWLVKEGWFEPLDGKRLKRNPITGMYASIRYRVLSHDEWAAKYPGHCRYTGVNNQSEEPGQADAHQSEKAGTTCPKKPEPPVRTVRTKTVVKTEEIDNNNSEAAVASPSNSLMEKEVSDSEIMGEFMTVMIDVAERPLESTDDHQKAAIDFFHRHGRVVAIESWKEYLLQYPQKVSAWNQAMDEYTMQFRKWPLHHFITSGAAEDFAQAIYSELAMESRSISPVTSSIPTLTISSDSIKPN
jgi:hypothetical protein